MFGSYSRADQRQRGVCTCTTSYRRIEYGDVDLDSARRYSLPGWIRDRNRRAPSAGRESGNDLLAGRRSLLRREFLCAERQERQLPVKTSVKRSLTDGSQALGNQGVFNTTNPTNPVARWNHIYIPYCTGDLHGGARENVSIPGVAGKQYFVGHRNIRNDLELLAPYFHESEDVALVGASAGGFGVLVNYPQVVEAFNGRSVAALVDSAPIIPESAIKTSCFERKVIQTFDLQLPDRCPKCADPLNGGLINLYNYLSQTYPQGRFAFASADADLAGVVLYNGESLTCGGSGVNIFNYRFSLYALRDKYIGHEWATYLPGGIQHTMTQSDALFLERKFRGVSAAEWLGRINGKTPSHIPAARLSRKDQGGSAIE